LASLNGQYRFHCLEIIISLIEFKERISLS
jgi:hypothetical protein